MASRVHTYPTERGVSSAAKTRRTKTFDELLEDKNFPTQLEPSQRLVFDRIIQRLRDSQVVVEGITSQSLAFMLPRGGSEYWQRSMNYPLLSSDLEMSTIFKLEPSTATSPHPPLGSHMYYVRSFRLSIDRSLNIVSLWEEKDIWPDECSAWKKATEFVKDGETDVFIRYIGMSTVLSGWGRFAVDLQERTSGMYGAWIAILAESYPDVIDSCLVYNFSPAATKAFDKFGRMFKLEISHTDSREQALIDVFGREVSLNRQAGGVSTSYQPPEEDVALFTRLKARGFSRSRELVKTKDYQKRTPAMQQGVMDWISDVCALGTAHPQELGTARFPDLLKEGMAAEWAKQAMPATFYDRVLIGFIGDSCPLAAMWNPCSFWSQPAQAVRYSKDTLARLQAYEEGKRTWHRSELNPSVEADVLPWTDYQYTPRRAHFRWESAESMRNYSELVQPLIVTTFERVASSIVRSNFVSLWSGHDFSPQVGEVDMRYWTHAGEVTGRGNKSIATGRDPNPDECFIHIPSLHPGADKYGPHYREFRRVLDMTMWQVDSCIDLALGVSAEAWEGPRSALCTEISTRSRQIWESSGCAKAFIKAKADSTRAYANRPGVYNKDPLRAYREKFDGVQVPVNSSGTVTIYWKKPGTGDKLRVSLQGGRSTNVHPPKGATGNDAVRTIHFLNTGIDIRDYAGNSMTYTAYKRSTSNPTFPGPSLRSKLEEKGTAEIRSLWESETGSDFDKTFPEGSDIPGFRCQQCYQANRECDKRRPCDRCIKAGLTCTPQALKPITGGRKSPVKSGSTKALASGSGTGTYKSKTNLKTKVTSSTPAKAPGAPAPGSNAPRSYAPLSIAPQSSTPQPHFSPYGTATRTFGARPNAPPSLIPQPLAPHLFTPQPSAPQSSTPQPLPPKVTDKGKGKAVVPNNEEDPTIAGKCTSCRLNGILLCVGRPCTSCEKRGWSCDIMSLDDDDDDAMLLD